MTYIIYTFENHLCTGKTTTTDIDVFEHLKEFYDATQTKYTTEIEG